MISPILFDVPGGKALLWVAKPSDNAADPACDMPVTRFCGRA